MRLENRIALVIGAARGIGAGIAERFVEEGARVVIADREAAGSATASRLGAQFVQIDIARKVFTPPVDEVRWARRVIAEMGDGTGAVMLEGKMQDDATVKQCRVMVAYARIMARRDPELAAAYGFAPAELAD